MKIKVTQEHIERGVVKDCDVCPVALAMQEAMEDDKVRVFSTYIETSEGNYITPESVGDFIDNFDEGLPVKPFEFELE